MLVVFAGILVLCLCLCLECSNNPSLGVFITFAYVLTREIMLLQGPPAIRTFTAIKQERSLFRPKIAGAVRRTHSRWQREHDVLSRWPSMTDCSPYAVLEQPRGGPYNKRRFYELVMVYHPDRWIHGEYHGIPKAMRVERYRLILAANAILSDPVKRRAYDERGVGWTLGGSSHAASGRNHQQAQTVRSRGSSMNATWEDWEVWRDECYRATHGHGNDSGRTRGGQQQATLMCGRRFVLTLLLLATTGSCFMLLAAWNRAKTISNHQLKIHETLLAELSDMGNPEVRLSRQERIGLFHKRRLTAVARQTQTE